MHYSSRRNRLRTLALTAFALVGASAPARADAPHDVRLALEADEALLLADDGVTVDALQQAEQIGEGQASYYGRELAGNRTASGERFDPNALTAAHRTLPLGSRLRVTNKANGKSVIVRVNDRGPFAHSRVVDISYGAAREIAMLRAGKAMVSLELLR